MVKKFKKAEKSFLVKKEFENGLYIKPGSDFSFLEAEGGGERKLLVVAFTREFLSLLLYETIGLCFPAE